MNYGRLDFSRHPWVNYGRLNFSRHPWVNYGRLNFYFKGPIMFNIIVNSKINNNSAYIVISCTIVYYKSPLIGYIYKSIVDHISTCLADK